MNRIQLPKWSEQLFEPHRVKVVYGGRGSGKSHTVVTVLLLMAARSKLRVLCAREFQNSISDSVHHLLESKIDDMGLRSFYEVQQTTIRGANGSEFIFAGLRNNSASIRSKEAVDICFVEEAQTVSEHSWETLIPTIRKEGSEIFVVFNPMDDTDPTYQRFVLHPPPDCISLLVNWDANPFFPEVLRAEKDYLYRVDPESADHVWGGKTRRNTEASVLRGRWRVESFEPGKDWSGPHYGADWGFATDPTTLVRCWVNGRTLLVEHEAYGIGVDLDDTPALFDRVPEARKHTIRADCSRPETISHMRRLGYSRIVPVEKGKGSVEDGVEHLRSYEAIVIHPRCTHTAEEARLWSYKVDRLTGDVKPELKDGNDHCMDALRYALAPIIRAGKPRAAEPRKPEPARDYRDRREAPKGWKVV